MAYCYHHCIHELENLHKRTDYALKHNTTCHLSFSIIFIFADRYHYFLAAFENVDNVYKRHVHLKAQATCRPSFNTIVILAYHYFCIDKMKMSQ